MAGLNSVCGDNLVTYPSMLARLVGAARAGRLQIQPRRILTMAEPLLPETRQAGEETWQAPIANMWGTSEAGVTAIGCFKGTGMHLTDDLVIVEAVDVDGDPVPAGLRSHKVYVTNLFNPLMPLIRYEITDEVKLLDEPCACGSVHQRIADIEGRNDDTFIYGDAVSVHPHLFRSILGRESAISEYRVQQTRAGAEIIVCAEGTVDVESLNAHPQRQADARTRQEREADLQRNLHPRRQKGRSRLQDDHSEAIAGPDSLCRTHRAAGSVPGDVVHLALSSSAA